MPILFWVSLAIVGVLAFNVLFVAVRLWATRQPAPIHATIQRRHRR